MTLQLGDTVGLVTLSAGRHFLVQFIAMCLIWTMAVAGPSWPQLAPERPQLAATDQGLDFYGLAELAPSQPPGDAPGWAAELRIAP